jgi:hypothetical protein
MLDDLLRISQLQAVDLEIQRLKGRLAQIPKEKEQCSFELKNRREELKAVKNRLTELKKSSHLLELDLGSVQEKINRYSAQLFSAKTNEEYKAFLNEIDLEKRRKAEIEERIIEVMEELEALQAKIKFQEAETSDAEAKTNDKLSELNSELDRTRGELLAVEQNRSGITAELKPEVLALYERIRQGKGGVALARLQDNRCSGCLTLLPPQFVIEVEKGDRICFCEYCGRILIPSKAR